jgi:hypothetical protein
MKHQPKVVRVFAKQRLIGERGDQAGRGAVSHQAVRVSIEHDRRIRFVAVEQELQHAAHV